MKLTKWILPIALGSVVFSACSSDSSSNNDKGPDCSAAPLVTKECLDGTWKMLPSRNAQASAVIVEAGLTGYSLPLPIETGEDSVTVNFVGSTQQFESINGSGNLATGGIFVVDGTGASMIFKGLWGSDVLDQASNVTTSAKVFEKADGYYLVLGNRIFSGTPSLHVAEVFYRSLTDE